MEDTTHEDPAMDPSLEPASLEATAHITMDPMAWYRANFPPFAKIPDPDDVETIIAQDDIIQLRLERENARRVAAPVSSATSATALQILPLTDSTSQKPARTHVKASMVASPIHIGLGEQTAQSSTSEMAEAPPAKRPRVVLRMPKISSTVGSPLLSISRPEESAVRGGDTSVLAGQHSSNDHHQQVPNRATPTPSNHPPARNAHKETPNMFHNTHNSQVRMATITDGVGGGGDGDGSDRNPRVPNGTIYQKQKNYVKDDDDDSSITPEERRIVLEIAEQRRQRTIHELLNPDVLMDSRDPTVVCAPMPLYARAPTPTSGDPSTGANPEYQNRGATHSHQLSQVQLLDGDSDDEDVYIPMKGTAYEYTGPPMYIEAPTYTPPAPIPMHGDLPEEVDTNIAKELQETQQLLAIIQIRKETQEKVVKANQELVDVKNELTEVLFGRYAKRCLKEGAKMTFFTWQLELEYHHYVTNRAPEDKEMERPMWMYRKVASEISQLRFFETQADRNRINKMWDEWNALKQPKVMLYQNLDQWEKKIYEKMVKPEDVSKIHLFKQGAFEARVRQEEKKLSAKKKRVQVIKQFKNPHNRIGCFPKEWLMKQYGRGIHAAGVQDALGQVNHMRGVYQGDNRSPLSYMASLQNEPGQDIHMTGAQNEFGQDNLMAGVYQGENGYPQGLDDNNWRSFLL